MSASQPVLGELSPTVRRARRAALVVAPLVAALGAAPVAVPAGAGAQPLADRVARVGDGLVRFRYAVRAGVCGDGVRGITIASHDGTSHFGDVVRSADGGWTTGFCEPGPAQVTVAVRGGVPREVRLAVGASPAGGRSRRDEERVVDLGTVPASAAAAYLLDLAATPDAPAPSRVLLGAAVADSSVVWPRLLGLARAERLPHATRREATFWASRFACDAVEAARRPLARGDSADRDVRKQVVFALSQRPGDERTAPLVRVARADRDPAVRCAALFWLGQGTGRRAVDPRVLDLYEGVLRGR